MIVVEVEQLGVHDGRNKEAKEDEVTDRHVL